ADWERSLQQAGLFESIWLKQQRSAVRGGGLFLPTATSLAERLPHLEGVLRIREGLSRLPKGLTAAATALALQSPAADAGWNALHRGLLHAEIERRLKQRPELHAVDGERIRTAFA